MNLIKNFNGQLFFKNHKSIKNKNKMIQMNINCRDIVSKKLMSKEKKGFKKKFRKKKKKTKVI